MSEGLASPEKFEDSKRQNVPQTKFLDKILIQKRVQLFRLVVLLVKRELQVKYRDSILGYLWSMLSPLLTMIVISFVFSHLVRGIDNYSMFILSGLLVWNMTGQALSVGTNSIVSGANLMRKVRVPAWIFPLVSLGSAATNLVLSLLPYSILFIYFGLTPSWNLVFFIPVLLLYFAFVGGIVLSLASLNVFFRDVAHVLEPALGLVFYATPIVYSRSMPSLPNEIRDLLLFNPFTHFIETFRAILFEPRQIPPEEFLILGILALVSLAIGSLVYKRNKSKFIFAL